MGEVTANNFLELSGKLYEKNKVKWKSLLKKVGLTFDEDIYNDTIIKVYEQLLENEYIPEDVNAYWYKSFLNNIKRGKQYTYTSKKEDVDVLELLRNTPDTIDNSHLYYPIIRLLLKAVKDNYTIEEYHLFKHYYLSPKTTYEDLSKLAGYNVKIKLNNIKKWLKHYLNNIR
jgi:hypothetical protein